MSIPSPSLVQPVRRRRPRGVSCAAFVGWLLTASLGLLLSAPAALALSEAAKLTPSDGAPADDFGITVAIADETAVVGADLDDDRGISSGAAYVYFFDGEAWIEEAKLTAADGATEDLFGRAVAIADEVIVVGAPLDDARGNASGSAYVFRHDGSKWVQEAKLTASDGGQFDLFGQAVSITRETIVIGAEGEGMLAGAAYVFRYDGAGWLQEAKLVASDAAQGNLFGRSVAVTTDVAVIGSDDAAGAGAAYVFRRDGASWIEEMKLRPAAAKQGDLFGRAVAAETDRLVIGARGDGEGGDAAGAAYVFHHDGNEWIEHVKLMASDAAAGDGFGTAVAVAGATTVVGSAESAYVIRSDGTDWFEDAKLEPSDGAPDDRFGSAVGVAGSIALVGAAGNGLFGAAYVFLVPEPSAWALNAVALTALACLGRRSRRPVSA